MRIFNLLLTLPVVALLAISSQAHAWGDHRTYRGPGPNQGYNPTYGGPQRGPVIVHPMRPPVVVHPIRPVYPTYQPYSYNTYQAPPVYWRTGSWRNTWHNNRYGWWWVTGNGWSFYSSPTYPYPEYSAQPTVIFESNLNTAPPPQPAPQVTVIERTAPAITQTAPAEPRPSGNAAPPSNSGMYYFCNASQLYYPYAKNCSERWTAVSSIPAD